MATRIVDWKLSLALTVGKWGEGGATDESLFGFNTIDWEAQVNYGAQFRTG